MGDDLEHPMASISKAEGKAVRRGFLELISIEYISPVEQLRQVTTFMNKTFIFRIRITRTSTQ